MKLKSIIIMSMFGLIVILILSCNTFFDHSKNKVLDDDEIIPVLIDMHIADGMLSQILNKDSMLRQSNVVYREIFRKHQTDYKTFKNSMIYYTNHPEQLTDIYKVVLDSVNNKLVLKKPKN